MKQRDSDGHFTDALRNASPSPADHFAAIWGELTEEQRAAFDRTLERVFAKRLGARLEQAANERRVPRCDRPMILRHRKNHPDARFWRCGGYVDGCRGIKPPERRGGEWRRTC
jgi:hypothetical protein